MASMTNSLKYSKTKKLHEHAIELKEKNDHSSEYTMAALNIEVLNDLEKIIATTSKELIEGLVKPIKYIMSTNLNENTVEHYVASNLLERTKQLNKDILKLVQNYRHATQVESDQYLTWSLNKKKQPSESGEFSKEPNRPKQEIET